jgi:hypothetical protein
LDGRGGKERGLYSCTGGFMRHTELSYTPETWVLTCREEMDLLNPHDVWVLVRLAFRRGKCLFKNIPSSWTFGVHGEASAVINTIMPGCVSWCWALKEM